MSDTIEWCSSELIYIKEFPYKYPITKEAIISFVDILISNAKARTGISENAIREYNKLFYDNLEFYFKTMNHLDVNSKDFEKLCSMFRLPIISNNSRSEEEMLPSDDTRQKSKESGNVLNKQKGSISMRHEKIGFMPDKTIFTHKDCLEMFNKLSPEEQIKFVVKFQNVEIKLSPSDILVIKSL